MHVKLYTSTVAAISFFTKLVSSAYRTMASGMNRSPAYRTMASGMNRFPA